MSIPATLRQNRWATGGGLGVLVLILGLAIWPKGIENHPSQASSSAGKVRHSDSTTVGGHPPLAVGVSSVEAVGKESAPVDLQAWGALKNRIVINPFTYQLSRAAADALKLSPEQVVKVNDAFRRSLDLVRAEEKANITVVPTDDGGQALLVPAFLAKGIEVRNHLIAELETAIGRPAADLLVGSTSIRDFRGRITAPTMFGGFGEAPRRLSLIDRDGQGTFVFEEVINDDGKTTSSRELRIDDTEVQSRYSHLLELAEKSAK